MFEFLKSLFPSQEEKDRRAEEERQREIRKIEALHAIVEAQQRRDQEESDEEDTQEETAKNSIDQRDVIDLKDNIQVIIPDNKILVKCPRCGRIGKLSDHGHMVNRSSLSSRMRVRYKCKNCDLISEHYFKFNQFVIADAFNLITGEHYNLINTKEILDNEKSE